MTTDTTPDRVTELVTRLYQQYEQSELGRPFNVETVEELTSERLVVRGSYTQIGRPGVSGDGVIPGPVQMAMADGFGWMLTVQSLPVGSDAYTIDMSMQFLRPLPTGEFAARCETLRWSPRRTVLTVALAPGLDAPTSTFITAAFIPRTPPANAGERTPAG